MEPNGPFGAPTSTDAGPAYAPADLGPYLASNAVIDVTHPAVADRARRLAKGGGGQFGIVRRCFEWVSNEVAHSVDCGAETVPCTAAEVLAEGHGLCYAKGHLFAALLRANGIPTGFDYQRLYDDRSGYALHGLNTVYLPDASKWFRVDPRGRPDCTTRLHGAEDLLLFSASGAGELDYRLNLPEPVPAVVRLLREGTMLEAVIGKLPKSVPMG